MPWRETCVVDERARFIAALREAEEPFAVVCKRFEISRKTGYKCLARYEQGGPAALVDGEPVARQCRHATPSDVVDAVIEALLRRRTLWSRRDALALREIARHSGQPWN
jgi:transposase